MIDSKFLTTEQKMELYLRPLLERIEELEKAVRMLQSPKLMYRRPGSENYEKVTDYLDDVEKRLQKIEEG